MMADIIAVVAVVAGFGTGLVLINCICDVICGGRENADRIMGKIWDMMFDANAFAWADEYDREDDPDDCRKEYIG